MAEEYIQSQIDALKQSLSIFEERKKELDRQAAPIREELTLWLALAKIRSGTPLSPNSTPCLIPLGRLEEEDTEESGGYGWKTQRLRDYVWEHREQGCTIRELSEFSVSIGAKPNYPYNWIRRLSEGEKPEIIKKGDRIFPSENLQREE